MGLSKLNPEHYIAIQYLSLPKQGGKTYEEIAAIAGCHKNSIVNWKKDPLFDKELKREIARQSLNRLPEVVKAMADAAIEDRNSAAGKLIMQAHGMLTDKLEVTTSNAKEDEINVDELKERAKKLREETTKKISEE